MNLGNNIKLLDKDYQRISFNGLVTYNCPKSLKITLTDNIGNISAKFFEDSIKYCVLGPYTSIIWKKKLWERSI